MAVAQNPYTAPFRLSSGRHGLSRGHVAQIQRQRLIGAAAQVVEEVGYARTSVAQIVARARVSRKTFYELFADREDCFLAAFDQALSEGRAVAKEAFRRESQWHEGIRCALAALLALMDEQPGLAKLCLLEAPAAGARVARRRAELLDELATVLDRGRCPADSAEAPPRLMAEGIAGAVFAVLSRRLLDERPEHLSYLLGALMSMIVLPYLGAHAASRELSRPSPEIPTGIGSRRPAKRTDPPGALNIRLTYRTLRVLSFLTEHRGASNREIAAGAGVGDPGQISKLLSRLAGLGLARNLKDKGTGTVNAWVLTPRGEQLERAASPRA